MGLGGLELPTKRLSAASSKQLVAISWLAKCPKWRGCVYGRFVSARSGSNFNETVSAASSLPQKFRFLAQRPLPRDSVRVCVRLLRRKAEHLVQAGPFRRQVGEASDAHAMREPAIDGGCSELATDNRLVGSSSSPSPTTHSHANGDFPKYRKMPAFGGLIFRPFGLWNEAFGFQGPFRCARLRPKNRVFLHGQATFQACREKPRIGGDSCAHFVSAVCRLNFRGGFGAFVSALQNRVSPRQRPVLVETCSNAESVRWKAD